MSRFVWFTVYITKMILFCRSSPKCHCAAKYYRHKPTATFMCAVRWYVLFVHYMHVWTPSYLLLNNSWGVHTFDAGTNVRLKLPKSVAFHFSL